MAMYGTCPAHSHDSPRCSQDIGKDASKAELKDLLLPLERGAYAMLYSVRKRDL
jgi:hypothetical protein